MSGQPTYPRHTQQGASSGTSSGSRYYTASQDPRPYQDAGILRHPSQAHLSTPRFVADGSAPTHTQSAVDRKWQYLAPSTASSRGSASGNYSSLDPAADAGARASTGNTQYGRDDKKADAGGADKQGSTSAWERMAGRLGGHDGGAGSSRDRTPLPEWLREI